MEYLVLVVCSFLYIGIKSFQQINVCSGKYASAFLTTQIMAPVEVVLTSSIAAATVVMMDNGDGHFQLLHISTPIGIGGGLGCLCGMYIQKKFSNKRSNSEE